MIEQNILPLFVAIPLAGAFLISLIGKKSKILPDVFGVLLTLILFILSLLSVKLVATYGTIIYNVGGWKMPLGIALVLDNLSAFMLVTVNLVVFFIAIYSINYMEKFTSKWKFYALFFLMLAGMNGLVITGDMFNLFVFLEIAAVASYALVAFGTEKHELEASFKYAVMGTIGSLFILLGIVFLYSFTSTLNMADTARVISSVGPKKITLFVSALFIMGFGLKAAIVPFHSWLPDAHPSAPAPISAMLSGVLIKSLGIYALCRILFNVIGINPSLSSMLMFLGALSMVVGVFLAVGQWDFKRLLAYHSISQVGYIIFAIGLGTPLGIAAGLFHLFNHSIFKSLLFLNSGAVEYATGTRDLKKMGGLAKNMPVTSTTTMIASMSIAGIPPFNGFWSKLFIIFAAVEAGRIGYALCAIIVSVLTLASFTKVMKYAFFGNSRSELKDIKEVPLFMRISMWGLAIICLLGGFLWFSSINDIFLSRAKDALLIGTRYALILLKGQ